MSSQLSIFGAEPVEVVEVRVAEPAAPERPRPAVTMNPDKIWTLWCRGVRLTDEQHAVLKASKYARPE